MLAILTADIVNSASYEVASWMPVIKEILSDWGESPADWEIYRGDEFQVRVAPENALSAAIRIKAQLKSALDIDVRIGIGLGDESFSGKGVSESNGTAYRRSGGTLELIKSEKRGLGIDTGSQNHNLILNLMIKLASDFMDNWSRVSAEIVALSLSQPDLKQSEMAKQLDIKQSAVSQRQKRARLSLLTELLAFYRQLIIEIES